MSPNQLAELDRLRRQLILRRRPDETRDVIRLIDILAMESEEPVKHFDTSHGVRVKDKEFRP